MDKSQIPTPALLIDLEAMEFNIAHMARFFEKGPTRLRPHFKTHKCPIIMVSRQGPRVVGSSG